MDALSLYRRYIAISIRAQLAYPATWVMKTIGHLLVTGIEFFGIWALFTRFGTLAGWQLHEVALIYGVVDVGFAIADATSRGFTKLGTLLKKGEFDRMLLRPRSVVLQLLGFEVQLMRFGRFLQGLVVMLWASASIAWTPATIVLAVVSILATASLFLGLAVLQGTSAFWTIENLEVWNAFTYGGNYAAEYPMSIYRRWFRRFFTVIIPLALTSYYPLLAILDRESLDALHWLAPLAGFAFLAVMLQVFKLGIRHHTSTGS